jgi:hypothetical protein
VFAVAHTWPECVELEGGGGHFFSRVGGFVSAGIGSSVTRFSVRRPWQGVIVRVARDGPCIRGIVRPVDTGSYSRWRGGILVMSSLLALGLPSSIEVERPPYSWYPLLPIGDGLIFAFPHCTCEGLSNRSSADV